MSSKILAFKLVSGEEIVAEVLDIKTDTALFESVTGKVIEYVVRRPHILRMMPTSHNNVSLAFIPWTLSNPEIESMPIPASAILLSFPPAAHVETQYISQTTGLELAKTTPKGRISV